MKGDLRTFAPIDDEELSLDDIEDGGTMPSRFIWIRNGVCDVLTLIREERWLPDEDIVAAIGQFKPTANDRGAHVTPQISSNSWANDSMMTNRSSGLSLSAVARRHMVSLAASQSGSCT